MISSDSLRERLFSVKKKRSTFLVQTFAPSDQNIFLVFILFNFKLIIFFQLPYQRYCMITVTRAHQRKHKQLKKLWILSKQVILKYGRKSWRNIRRIINFAIYFEWRKTFFNSWNFNDSLQTWMIFIGNNFFSVSFTNEFHILPCYKNKYDFYWFCMID